MPKQKKLQPRQHQREQPGREHKMKPRPRAEDEKYRGSLRRSGCGSSELLQNIQPENRSRSEGDLRSGPSSVFGFNTNQQPKEIVCRNQK